MKLKDFKYKMENLIDEMEDVVNQMPDTGLKSDTSQKVALKNAIFEVMMLINGTTEYDLVENNEE